MGSARYEITIMKNKGINLIRLMICLGAFYITLIAPGNILYAGGRTMDPTVPEAQEKQAVLVRFKQEVTVDEAEKMAHNLGLEVVKAYPPMAVTQGRVLLLVQSQELTAQEVIALMQEQPNVLDAEINITRSIQDK